MFSMIDWSTVWKVALATAVFVAFVCLVMTKQGREALALLALRALDALTSYFERRLSEQKMSSRTVDKRGYPY